MLPCLIFEDEHLLVVNKPAGMNTHAPSPYAGEGLYDWLRQREPRWASLAIIHRLDKETSGVIVFSKTRLANRSLTEQFTRRAVVKKYVLLTDRRVPRGSFAVRSKLARVGVKYASVGPSLKGEHAETRFLAKGPEAGFPGATRVEALPLSGRTHQIRVQAAERGFPILGDVLYGGTPAHRVCLHAWEISFRHPESGCELSFSAPPDFQNEPRESLRSALMEAELTDSYRVVHGASDGWPGWYVDRVGDYLLSQAAKPIAASQMEELEKLRQQHGARGVYHKILARQVRADTGEHSPRLALGEPAPSEFIILENGIRFELSFAEGYSIGLFLDQRDNRRRLLSRHVAADFVLSADSHRTLLNTFAYTCGFSVCAAKAGFATTSLDLSKNYLEWGRRNFELNGLDSRGHDFVFGDAFDWFRRLKKKGKRYDVIVLDPPTFSQSRESGVFRAERDYGKLVESAVPLLSSGGVLFASTNAGSWSVEAFLTAIEGAVVASRRRVLRRHYFPQPPDFPISHPEPAYLKTLWLQLE